MEKRTLGRTGYDSTVVALGAVAVSQVSQDVADQAIELALEHGVNHIDVAPTYGEAMERLAPWMPRVRDRVFLGAKTTKRRRDEAWQNIRECMRRLGVDSFDLFQLHGVTTMDELDAVTAPGGALEALVEMREQGLTRWLGITGHGPEAARVQLEALHRFDFDTIMFPFNPALYLNPEYRRDAEALISEAISKDVGIQIIKMIARGGWGDRKREFQTWYEPHREQVDIDRALWWLLSQPVHTAPCSGEITLLGKVLDAAERFAPLSATQQQEIISSQTPPVPEPGLGILSAV